MGFDEIVGIICISSVMLSLVLGGLILCINCLFKKKDKLIDKLNKDIDCLLAREEHLVNRNNDLCRYVNYLQDELSKIEEKTITKGKKK